MIYEPRPYRDQSDLRKMADILIAGRRAGCDTYYVHVGDLNWWIHYLAWDAVRPEVIFLWEAEREEQRLIGWSLLSPRFAAFDVFLHPEELGTEQARHIWAWTEARMVDAMRRIGGRDVSTMWVSESDGWLTALLEGRQFSRQEAHMLAWGRSLDEPIPGIALPQGYRVRTLAGDRETEKRANLAYVTFGSTMPYAAYVERYRAFTGSPGYSPDLDLVAVAPDDRFAAFCICWLDTVNQVGLLEPVGTAPNFRRQGLAQAVVAEGLRRMRSRGMAEAIVCAAHDNLAAQRLYASLGFGVERRILTYSKQI
jgi:mycothiol synthase